MVAVPAPTPVTTPAPDTVATATSELAHAPNGVVLLSVVVWPTHTVAVPVIVAGTGFTLTTDVDTQPVLNVYVITEVPEVMPQNKPVVALIVPTAGALLLQVPPGVGLESVLHIPEQALVVPVIAPGTPLTDTAVDVIQPLGKV